MKMSDAQNYWKYVPDGIGKRNSEDLLFLTDHALMTTWQRCFENRMQTYPEERDFILKHVEAFWAKRIFSVGSGMGFHEIAYAGNGAHVTCFDIVASNLRVIERIAQRGLHSPIQFKDTITDLPCDEEYDVFYFWGSLHHMPVELQKAWLQIAEAMLVSHGQLIIMSYTWQYVKCLCPDMTKETFDPVRFGFLSDPAVNGLANPFSDWHDAEKIMSLRRAPFRLIEEKLFNKDLFAWYVFEKIK